MQLIRNLLEDFFVDLHLNETLATTLADIGFLLFAISLSIITYYIVKIIFIKAVKNPGLKKGNIFMVSVLENPLLLNTLKLVPTIFMFQMIQFTDTITGFLSVVLKLFIAYLIIKIINSFLDLINTLHIKYNKQAGKKPIKGILTFIKAILVMVIVIILFADLIGKSPTAILTALGAMSAVLMLIFRDSILGLVAGFQMSANDLIRIGDWIEMPKYGVDGDVIDVTLTFVKVQNWDKTIVTVPAYLLISESFTNWRSVFELGGRRIKRSVNLDGQSVKIVDKELYNKLLKVDFVKEYLIERQAEIERYNKERNIDITVDPNGRKLTNLGVFRIYLIEYLKRNPSIHQDLFILVRQLQYEGKGIPLEVYAFSNKTAWADYEGVAADIFDHIYATLGYFELRLFQEPSGYDISKKISNE